MSPPIVKICGVRTAHAAGVAADAGADMVGLIFAESRRQVAPETAREIIDTDYRRRPRFVGVFVNADRNEIARIAAEVRLDTVQLSGNETPAYCAELRIPYLKVIHVRPGMSAAEALREAQRYQDAEAVVLDSAGSNGTSSWGGSGVAVDVELARDVVRSAGKPIIIAGGLRPDTVGALVRAARPWGVDVSSGIETDGVKDDRKIVAFVNAAKGRHQRLSTRRRTIARAPECH